MSKSTLRGIVSTTPDWAVDFLLGTDIGVQSGKTVVCGKVAGYSDKLERLYGGHTRTEDNFWVPEKGQFILVQFVDGSEYAYALNEVVPWNEEKKSTPVLSALCCAVGLHRWDDAPRRGLVRTIFNFSLFSSAEQFGEQRCRCLGCNASRQVKREGFIGFDSQPKWSVVTKDNGTPALADMILLGVLFGGITRK
jgi:hypothetical protein